MNLTPLDIENISFRSGFRGYNRDEVERFRSDVIRALEDYIAAIGQLNARLATLEAELVKYRESEELLKNSVVLAQRTCDELIAAAHGRADAIEREARVGENEIRHRLTELKSEREQCEYSFYGLLSGFMRRLEQTNPALSAPAPSQQLPQPTAPANPAAAYVNVPVNTQPAPGGQGAPAAPPAYAASNMPPAQPPLFGVQLPQPAAPAPLSERDSDAQAFTAALDSVQVQPPTAWPPAATSDAPASPAEDAATDTLH